MNPNPIMTDQAALEIVPLTLSAAHVFVNRYHRHNKASQGGLFAVGLARDGEIVGAATAGRPVARRLADAWTVEVTRCCVVEGIKNGCSMLYRALWRAARALGYKKCITYTLQRESGASLRGAGFILVVGECGGGSWTRRERPRVDRHELGLKMRWEITEG